MDEFVPLVFHEKSADQMLNAASSFYDEMETRRTTRHFSEQPVPRELIEFAVKTAGTAPSGAHLQPWTFVAISNPSIKQQLREAAETEEKRFYEDRIPDAWAEVLAPLGTDFVKEHIKDAPWVIVLFRHSQRIRENGEKSPTYYSQESCGIAAGLFIAAIHNMGLCTLTHTPSPMGFLRELLERPEHEHAMLLLPVGYPSPDATVPNIQRKTVDEILEWRE
jgi:nitroreductase